MVGVLEMDMKQLDNGSYTLSEIPAFVTVGKYCSIACDVIFHSHDREHLCSVNRQCVYTTNWDQPRDQGEIVIGNDVWIGDGVRILSNTKIGNGAIIGAGAVVASDVPPYTIAIGNPWRVLRKRFSDDQILRLERIKWWDWTPEIILERREEMKNIETFLNKYDK